MGKIIHYDFRIEIREKEANELYEKLKNKIKQLEKEYGLNYEQTANETELYKEAEKIADTLNELSKEAREWYERGDIKWVELY